MGRLIQDDGTILYTSTPGYLGIDTFVYRIDDGRGGIAEAAVTVTVTPRSSLASQFAVGIDRDGNGTAQLLNPDRTIRHLLTDPLNGATEAGVRVAAGDFTGDGVADLVVGSGPGVITRVRVIDGVTHAELFEIQPFEDELQGGVFVSCGDMTGDGIAELIISPDEGGGLGSGYLMVVIGSLSLPIFLRSKT